MVEASSTISAPSSRPIYDPVIGATADAGIVERDSLQPGVAVAGPAVIVEPQTTTVLGAHHHAVMQPDGTLRITRTPETGTAGEDR